MSEFSAGMKRVSRSLAIALVAAVLLLIVRPVSALDPQRKMVQLHHTAWTARDDLAFTQILSMAQTPDGFIWLGTSHGLYRFDGVRAEQVLNEQIPAAVPSLATDAQGALWMSLPGALGRLGKDGLKLFNLPQLAIEQEIRWIVPDPDGTLWAATRYKVRNFDGKTWRELDDPWPISASTWSDPGGVWAVALAKDGTIWTKNLLGLYFLRRGSTSFEEAKGYAGSRMDFVRDQQGQTWTADVATNRFYVLPDLEPGKPLPQPRLVGGVVPADMAGAFTMDRDGAVWAANRATRWLFRVSSATAPGPADIFTMEDGLTEDVPRLVFEDREGSIWVPTLLGLSRFRNMRFAPERQLKLRTQAPVLAPAQDALYVFTGMRAVLPDPTGHAGGRLLKIKPGLPPEVLDENVGQLTSMAASPDGSLVLSRDGELFRWRNGRQTKIAVPPEVQSPHVANLIATDDGLVVSFYKFGVYRLASGAWKKLWSPTDNPDEVGFVALDAAGGTWLMLTAGRFLRLEPGPPVEFDSPIGAANATLPDPDGLIMLTDQGMARFDGRAMQYIKGSRFPFLQNGLSLVRAGEDIWILTMTQALRVNRAVLLKAFADPDAPLTVESLGATEGFTGFANSGSYNASAVMGPDARIWLMLRETLAWIDPAHPYPARPAPPVVVTSMLANGTSHEPSGSLKLPPGTSQLELDYTAPGLAIPEQARFRYQLEGVDRTWVEAGSRRQAFYTNLDPGEYRFRVIAANSDGVWNEQGATVHLEIEPTFIQSIWFTLLVFVTAAGLVWLGYRLLLEQQAARLHRRFALLMAERERIARELHDTLLQGAQGLILQFDSVAGNVPKDSALYEPTQQAIKRAEAVIAEGRNRVRELRTAARTNLSHSLGELSRELATETSPRIAFSQSGEQRPLNTLVSEELLRIATEATRNAIRHASAQTIEIALSFGAAELQLDVRDNGKGMPHQGSPVASEPGHYGLIGMRERAERIGGRLRIFSREGTGTAISITVPGAAAYVSNRGRLLRWLPGFRNSGSIDSATGAR